jgi:hypothetical protein
MRKPRIDSIMLECYTCQEPGVAVSLRIFDADRCKWDVVDVWCGDGVATAVGLAEALTHFERLAVALAAAQGVQLELPFP